MNSSITRRRFMQGAGTGLMAATAYSPFAYGANDVVRVGVIGTGGQGSFHLRNGLATASQLEVAAVCDVYKPNQEAGWELASHGDQRQVARYFDYRRMLEEESLDAVVISTPLDTHHRIAMDCLDVGKYVFCEKTLCYTIGQAREIVQKCHDTGLFCQVGHQRRYNPFYNKAMWLAVDKGLLGRIIHIAAQWHRNNDWRRPVDGHYVLDDKEREFIHTDLEHHINWRLYRAHSGGLMTELATHQLDVATWFLGGMPARVYGSGGSDYWRDGRDVHDNVSLTYEYEMKPGMRGYRAIEPRNAYQDAGVINQPYTVRVDYSSLCANAKPGASELIQGDRGAFELTEPGGKYFAEPVAKNNFGRVSAAEVAKEVAQGATRELSYDAYTIGSPILIDNATDVDSLQFAAFAKDIREKGTPKANQMVGLMATICAEAGLRAMQERSRVEFDPAWHAFDFQTPDPCRYEFWPEPGGESPEESGDAPPPSAF